MSLVSHARKWVIPTVFIVVATSILAEIFVSGPAEISTPIPPNVSTLGSTTEPTIGITIEPTAEVTTQPTIERTTEPATEVADEFKVEATIEPTAEVTIEPTLEIATEPTVEVTEEPTVEATIEEPTIEVTTEPMAPPTLSPQPAKIIYVQSNGRSHELNLITSDGVFISSLHRRAAAPAWSLDGTAIAFFGEEGISELGDIYRQGNGIWIIGAQGQGVRQLIPIDHVKNMAWSPDGQKLAFEIDLAPQGGSEIRIVEASEGREISRFSGQQPAWSPDSQQLIIKNCASNCGLWRVNIDSGGGQQITFDSTDGYPSWSPNGQYLVFTSQRDNNWEIYRLRLSDGELRNLTNRPSTDTTPVFSRNGREIYLRTDHPGDWWITAINRDGSNERAIFGGIGPSDDWGLARPAVH